MGIFGSYVKRQQHEESDLDILVEFEENAKIDLIKFMNMENYLQDMIGIKIDLVEKSSLKPKIAKQVLDEVSVL